MNNVLKFTKQNEEETKTPRFYNTKDVAEILGCNQNTARAVMRKKDFPLIIVGKNWKVSRTAFEKWCEQRHA